MYQRHGYIYSALAGYVLKKNEGEKVRIVADHVDKRLGWASEAAMLKVPEYCTMFMSLSVSVQ